MNCKRRQLEFCFVFIFFCAFFNSVRLDNNDNKKTGEIIAVASEDDDDGKIELEDGEIVANKDTFVPTTEWQEILPGQAIPRGLHVRINLQSGHKEAKLMDEDENVSDKTKKLHLTAKAREQLQQFTADDVKEVSPEVEESFKTIDELRKEFRELKIDMKTDYEIMKEYVDRLRNKSIHDDERIGILAELEYYVHQFDNAQDFVKMRGFELVLPSFNSTNEELKANAAFILGSAMQSNPKVQIAALESGLLAVLLRTIVYDSSNMVRGRCLYALSCLVRHFPLAQQHFLEHGGLMALSNLFKSQSEKPEVYKLQVKVITLLNDLAEEQDLAILHLMPDDKAEEEKRRQYSRVQLKRSMVERGWCSFIARPLAIPEHDGREKVLRAMLSFAKPCRKDFSKAEKVLKGLLMEYADLAVAEMSQTSENVDLAEVYFLNIKEMIQRVLVELLVKDEL